jgi:CBS domain-containing protein
MMNNSIPARCCRIYQRQGEAETHALAAPPTARASGLHGSGAEEVELRHVMCRDLVCARPDLDIQAVINLIVQNHFGCIPVVDEQRRPIGMITKFDIVEQVDAFLRSASNGSPLPIDLAARTADEVMMPIALTLQETASVADAASMMTCEDMHHVLVVSPAGALVGVVSSKDIVTWLVRNDGLMPTCPSCGD